MLCFIDGFRVTSDGSDKVWSCSISLVSCYDAEGNARKEPIVKPFSNETTDVQIASSALFRAQHTILNPIRSKINLDGFGRIKRRNELGYSFDSVCVTIVGASSAIHFTALPVTSKKLNLGAPLELINHCASLLANDNTLKIAVLPYPANESSLNLLTLFSDGQEGILGPPLDSGLFDAFNRSHSSKSNNPQLARIIDLIVEDFQELCSSSLPAIRKTVIHKLRELDEEACALPKMVSSNHRKEVLKLLLSFSEALDLTNGIQTEMIEHRLSSLQTSFDLTSDEEDIFAENFTDMVAALFNPTQTDHNLNKEIQLLSKEGPISLPTSENSEAIVSKATEKLQQRWSYESVIMINLIKEDIGLKIEQAAHRVLGEFSELSNKARIKSRELLNRCTQQKIKKVPAMLKEANYLLSYDKEFLAHQEGCIKDHLAELIITPQQHVIANLLCQSAVRYEASKIHFCCCIHKATDDEGLARLLAESPDVTGRRSKINSKLAALDKIMDHCLKF
ncbi:hypothetical protein DSO57_1026773 [Entomophthora muscae]|uniref:Uncharacterized protein n=1 Tax=Entomophthora muscae TaxID=34485 RepID=A0ACC2SEU0_9FUNG|nr:hypothetical protein DSO57_1026773 [Entomophthora muscae]